MLYVQNDNKWDSRVLDISIGGSKPTIGEEYEAGHIDYAAIGLNLSDYNEPTTNTPYIMWVTSRWKWRYEVTATLDTGFEKIAKVIGNYVPRKNITIAGQWTEWSSLFIVSDTNAIDFFFPWDSVNRNNSITAVAKNGLNLSTSTPFTMNVTGIHLSQVESDGLIDRLDTPSFSWNNIVVEGGKINFADSSGF
jgi:hypothetical protein